MIRQWVIDKLPNDQASWHPQLRTGFGQPCSNNIVLPSADFRSAGMSNRAGGIITEAACADDQGAHATVNHVQA